MTIATEYTELWIQKDRQQPMYDKTIHRFYNSLLNENPNDIKDLESQFKNTFTKWILDDKLNNIVGYDTFSIYDICIGCTHYIDDLYQTKNIVTFEGDYKYHMRLNPNIVYATLDNIEYGQELLISMPFVTGSVHHQMDEILDVCYKRNVPVHIDGAWITCSKNINFDLSHPAINSLGVSLSKGLGLGSNRIGLRFSRSNMHGPISIMNQFNMNCKSLVYIGLRFMEMFHINYMWDKYAIAYEQICRDFKLTPSNAIHLAYKDNNAVGVRPLLRYLNDK